MCHFIYLINALTVLYHDEYIINHIALTGM